MKKRKGNLALLLKRQGLENLFSFFGFSLVVKGFKKFLQKGFSGVSIFSKSSKSFKSSKVSKFKFQVPSERFQVKSFKFFTSFEKFKKFKKFKKLTWWIFLSLLFSSFKFQVVYSANY